MTQKELQEELGDLLSRFDFMDQIRDGKIPLDFNGHFYSPETNPQYTIYNKEYLQDAVGSAYLVHKGKLTDPVSMTILHRCSQCTKVLQVQYDGQKIKVLDSCPYPQGYPTYTFELNVPSGKLVVGNNFRDIFPVLGEYNINCTMGCDLTSQEYAKVGLAHAYVGNTCPDLYRKNKSTLFIGQKLSRLGKRVAGICTDLWWYSIADYDEYLRRGGVINDDVNVVNVQAGLYQFKHQKHLLADDSQKGEIYTYINRIGEPLPLRDYKKEYNALNFTAEQVFTTLINDDFGVQAVANQLMVVIGGGVRFHPNGWATYGTPQLEKDTPETKIPVFDQAYHWYGLSSSSPICRGVSADLPFEPEFHFNSSFVDLATNILQCIIRHGSLTYNTKVCDYKLDPEEVPRAKELLKLYVKKYPNDVPDHIKALVES